MPIVPAAITIELGHQTLEVADLSHPVWFGDYQGGKLGIYEATVTGSKIAGAVTYLCTFTEHGGKDFITYSNYLYDIPVADIIQHLQENVFKAYEVAAGESEGTFFCDPVGYGSEDRSNTIH